jgi:hypothetical protein
MTVGAGLHPTSGGDAHYLTHMSRRPWPGRAHRRNAEPDQHQVIGRRGASLRLSARPIRIPV